MLARKLEPVAGTITQGLPFVAVRDVRRAERELETVDVAAEPVVGVTSSADPIVASSEVDPAVRE